MAYFQAISLRGFDEIYNFYFTTAVFN